VGEADRELIDESSCSSSAVFVQLNCHLSAAVPPDDPLCVCLLLQDLLQAVCCSPREHVQKGLFIMMMMSFFCLAAVQLVPADMDGVLNGR
jgi:hypothetical protein